ncbi:MAG: hypothetical protein H6Q68_2504 [Firmicutes bacterium]|nr:hypothetical protein [Bacillota bacterium]
MGIPKSFNFLGCLEVTFILRDFKTVTGKIIRDFDDRKSYDYDKYDDHKKDDDCKKEEEDKCCKPPTVDVKVDVDDKCDFILVELTREAESVSLQGIEAESDEIEIEVVNVEFKKGSCIAINVCDIIYAGVNAEIEEEEIEIEFESDLTTSNSTTTVPTTEPTA